MGETTEKTHLLKPYCGSWTVETGGRSVEEVVTFINGFSPNMLSNITRGAQSYEDAHAAIEEARGAIRAEAVKLAEVWEGEASVEAQTALGILYVTMGRLAEKLAEMSGPLETLATVVGKHQGFIGGDHSEGLTMQEWSFQTNTWDDDIGSIGFRVYKGALGPDGDTTEIDWWTSQNDLAGKHLQIFNNDLAVVHGYIPNTVEKGLRDISPPTEPGEDPTPVEYPPGLTGDDGGVTPLPYDGSNLDDADVPPFGSADPSVPGYEGPNPDGTYPDGTYPDGTNPGGTDPGGSNPGGTDPNGGYPPGATPVTSTANPNGGVDPYALNRNPSGNGNDPTTSLADYNPTTSGYTPTTSYTPTAYGTPTTNTPHAYGYGTGIGGGGAMGAATGGGIGSRTASTGGMPFLPMGGMGGGGGADSQDRESTTWLHEDDDVWNDDTGSVNSTIA